MITQLKDQYYVQWTVQYCVQNLMKIFLVSFKVNMARYPFQSLVSTVEVRLKLKTE